MNERPPVPLDHRIRRRILRRLHIRGACTSSELSTNLKLELTKISYHAQVLGEYDNVTEHRRGVDRANTRFESKVADNPEVIALLAATEAEDEPQ